MIKHSKPHVDKKDILAVSKQVASGMHATGSVTEEFEEKICEYIGIKYAKAVNSGTSALFLSLKALGVCKGQEVILPSYVCQSVLSAVKMVEAKPVFVDIEEGKFNIGVKEIEKKISKKTKVVVVPHMFGQVADIVGIKKLGIPVIEDCAQSIGATFSDGSKVGSKGDISVFSFYATKVISTGQGGMVVTNSKKIWKRILDLTTYDGKEKYSIGYNFSLSDIQSALGLNQLKKLEKFVKKRREIGKKYDKAFGIVREKSGSFPFRYILMLKSSEERDLFESYLLLKKGIKTDKPVFKSLHQYFGLKGFENTEKMQNCALSIPVYPALSEKEIRKIIYEVGKLI